MSGEPEILLWDVRRVATACGLAVRTIWAWADCGRIPAPLHIGGARRWRAEEIREWVATGCPDVRRPKQGDRRG
ncbi:MAG: AlpA family phage regulatory protein [Candidatus Hydrogenedentes bacterium]|nr:AlpA family phage regulatory protein [Candidatus Hydrogenedentota bacterium]